VASRRKGDATGHLPTDIRCNWSEKKPTKSTTVKMGKTITILEALNRIHS
jgi:hypothetical protein